MVLSISLALLVPPKIVHPHSLFLCWLLPPAWWFQSLKTARLPPLWCTQRFICMERGEITCYKYTTTWRGSAAGFSSVFLYSNIKGNLSLVLSPSPRCVQYNVVDYFTAWTSVYYVSELVGDQTVRSRAVAGVLSDEHSLILWASTSRLIFFH